MKDKIDQQQRIYMHDAAKKLSDEDEIKEKPIFDLTEQYKSTCQEKIMYEIFEELAKEPKRFPMIHEYVTNDLTRDTNVSMVKKMIEVIPSEPNAEKCQRTLRKLRFG